MVSFTVRMRFRPEDLDHVRAALVSLTEASRNEPGCLLYIAHFVEADPANVLIYEQYRDEAALTAHRATPHFAKYATQELYPRTLSREVEALTAIS